MLSILLCKTKVKKHITSGIGLYFKEFKVSLAIETPKILNTHFWYKILEFSFTNEANPSGVSFLCDMMQVCTFCYLAHHSFVVVSWDSIDFGYIWYSVTVFVVTVTFKKLYELDVYGTINLALHPRINSMVVLIVIIGSWRKQLSWI